MLPIIKRLDPDDHYDGVNHIEFIVTHDTGNYTDSDEGNANYFITGTRNASAHYFVDDNSITQVVEDKDGAFHCGDGYGRYGITNRNSIGIEMCRVNGTVTTKTENNTIELIKYLMSKYNIPAERVVRHYDASRKICPQSFSSNNWTRWNAFKAKLTENEKLVNPILKAQIQALQYNLNIDYNAKLELTGYADNATIAALKGIQSIIVKGHKSNVIKWLQQKLTTYGYLAGGQDTGAYDEPTFQAVTNMQSKWGRPTDGVLRIETWNIFLNN